MVERGTLSERQSIRNIIFSDGAQTGIRENEDGTWHADVYGIVIEAGSAAELLRELAHILEES